MATPSTLFLLAHFAERGSNVPRLINDVIMSESSHLRNAARASHASKSRIQSRAANISRREVEGKTKCRKRHAPNAHKPSRVYRAVCFLIFGGSP